jgi:hypothetical protein
MLSPFPVLLLAMWLLVTACLGMVIYIVLAGGITKPVIGTELPLIAAGHPLVTEMRL